MMPRRSATPADEAYGKLLAALTLIADLGSRTFPQHPGTDYVGRNGVTACIPTIRDAAHELREQANALRAVSRAYVDMIHGAEQRCMAADGPVTKTCDEITDDELRTVYVLASAALAAKQSTNPA